MSRAAARAEHERKFATVLRIKPDRCKWSYGEQVTNLITESEQFDHADWSGSATVTANSIAAPDGTITADTIDDSNGASNLNKYQSVTVADDSSLYIASIYLKQGTADQTQFKLTLSGGTQVSSDPVITWSTLQVSEADNNYWLDDIGNGWYRLSLQVDNNGTGNTTATFVIWPAKYTSDGSTTGTVYAWGAQLVNGVKPGGYVKTTSASATDGCTATDAKANLLTYSKQFDHPSWLTYTPAVITPNTDIAPDGTLTADTVEDDSAVISKLIMKIITGIDASKNYTAAIKIKKDSTPRTTRFVALRIKYDGSTQEYNFIHFDTATGEHELYLISGDPDAITKVELKDDYWLISISAKSQDAANTSVGFWFFPAIGASASWLQSVTAVGSVVASDAQLVKGSVPGRYYNTEATPFTGTVGTECYNTFTTCQHRASYDKISSTLSLISEGAPIPAGETLRPYITDFSHVPPELDLDKGLSRRGSFELTIKDETDSDRQLDPYADYRAKKTGGSFWTRWLARNKNYSGRFAEALRGYPVAPWDWSVFQTELYIIENIDRGNDGSIKIHLTDYVQRADYVQVPVPTTGKLLSEIKDYEDIGTAQAGGTNTITLRTKAEAVDGYYNGMAVKIYDQTGAGQEDVIIAYVGATREATMANNWQVIPDSSSLYYVQKLQIEVEDALGPQYDVYGVPGYIRVGKEIIKFTSRVDGVLSWPDTSYRQQFGTPLKKHSEGSQVQVVKAFEDAPFNSVINWFYNEAGITDTYINVAGLNSEVDTWLGKDYNITIPLSSPERISKYLQELAQISFGTLRWSPVDQQVIFKIIAPPPPATIIKTFTDEANFIGIPESEDRDDLRVTDVAMYYDLASATDNHRDDKNYLRGFGDIDLVAKSTNEYNDERIDVKYARWFGAANDQAVKNYASRKLQQFRDAPNDLTGKIDPKDYDIVVGEFLDVNTASLVDFDGHETTTRVVVTRLNDRGKHIDVRMRTTIFANRFAFFAPNSAADYPANEGYACFSDNAGQMSDGSDGYLFY